MPQERLEKQIDSNIQLINHNGQSVKEIRVRENKRDASKKESQ